MAGKAGHDPTNLGRLRPFIFTQAWTQTNFAEGMVGSRVVRIIRARTLAEAIHRFCNHDRSSP